MVSVYNLPAANAAQRCARAHIQTRFCYELRPFLEITGFTLTLLVIVLRSDNFEENSEESRLFTGANLVLPPASGRSLESCLGSPKAWAGGRNSVLW